LQKEFGNRLRFVFRNFPLRELHPHAEAAAETAEFAGEHKKFWEMHDLIFENQSVLSDRLFGELAQRLGLDVNALRESVRSGEFSERVAHDFSGGVRSGVNGTPTFFINGARHDSSFDFATLADALQQAAATHK
jgi:protein-disulfide isomerase